MRTRRSATIEDLRRAIDCLPRHTKVAMLEGIRANPIIVGAYSDDGGICPMLAAHRAGGRTNVISFARAWDRYAFRGDRSRELAARPGWAWMRVFRRYDEYEHALARLESDSRAAEREPVH